ncbi:magnesium transporter [Thioalkalivibrio sulfidiphilus HL-EbGr7]|uniref:Magnesium transporter MgtE n=1 Tax=Thioalkalivibrio sulfidiphilus (strain HL-EbGR7) TaxID=396588 RepID=B8GT66_THISH|nr:magnesium transporter [Thioalkalivibrio sulfidiphilus]ACL73081.1 magnesium transporter [Thioalkalivibrio sulfidiphilus HL-EbGr7]
MSETDVIENLPELIATRDWDALRGILGQLADQDIARATPDLAPQDRERLFAHLLSPERASNVFSYLSTEQQTEVLDALEDEDKARLIGELHYDDAAALLDELPDEHTELLMEMLPVEDQQVLQALLTYPEDSAGRLMNPEFITVRPDWSVGQALDHVREQHDVGENVNMVFVTSAQGQVLGTLRLRDLLLARPSTKVHDIGHGDVISIGTDEDQEEAARVIRHYDLEVLPVVDDQGVMRGIITLDDILDVVEEETTEDFQKMGSVGVVGLSLKEASASLLYRKRIGWLVILVVVNIFSGMAIALFEAAIETVVALVFFLPLVIASGGNAGAQSSTLMVRALATGDVQTRDWLKLWGKELLVSAALGATMGLAVWGAGIWLGGVDVGLAVAISMVLVVVMASMFGMVLPFALNRFGLDPASASAPLITSVADVFGILIYFSVATAVLL